MSPIERLEAAVPGLAKAVEAVDGTPCVEVDCGDVREVMQALRDACGFETNTFVTAIDHSPAEPRFSVEYQFLSIEHADRLRVRVWTTEDDPKVPTVSDLWPGAAYAERECFDMFGIVFEGHDGLRRLLLPEGYDHHPLRKEFPHQGIEPDRLYREWERRRAETNA